VPGETGAGRAREGEGREEDIVRALAEKVSRPVVVIGAGSDLRGDDAFGLEAARAIEAGGGIEGVEVLEGGVSPENLAERAARSSPRTVLVLDAARFGGEPGELRLIDPGELSAGLPSTHAASLELLAEYLARRCGAGTLLLVAEPASTAAGAALSRELSRAARRAAEVVKKALDLA
jgi:hydrogenase 3 maturation protease